MQRWAAIDIGTNSTRLLVAEMKGSTLVPVYQDVVTTRLGEGGQDSQTLLAPAMERTAAAVTKFYRQAQDLGAEVVRLFGTSALREADNQEQFQLLVKSQVGQRPEVLSGDREAHLTYLGAVRALGLTEPVVVMDVGGGSTEIIWGQGRKVLSAVSIKVGAVRLTEKYLPSDPPTALEWAEMAGLIFAQLQDKLRPLQHKVKQAVAVGGTATTVAAMVQGLVYYDRAKVQGYFVPHQRLTALVQTVRFLPVAQRRNLPGLQPERADIIAAGAAVLSLAVSILDMPGLTVSDADLLLGSLYDYRLPS